MKCPTCGQPLDMQSKGGTARAAALSDQRRIEIAKKAAKARWAKHTKEPKAKRPKR